MQYVMRTRNAFLTVCRKSNRAIMPVPVTYGRSVLSVYARKRRKKRRRPFSKIWLNMTGSERRQDYY